MEDFTNYDIKPEGFLNYLRYYGEHFNRKLCQFACKQLKSEDYTKEKIDNLIKSFQIEMPDSKLYDIVYIANWCKSVFYSSSITDEQRLILFIRDILNSEQHLIFNRWYADMAKQGIPIDWKEMI